MRGKKGRGKRERNLRRRESEDSGHHGLHQSPRYEALLLWYRRGTDVVPLQYQRGTVVVPAWC